MERNDRQLQYIDVSRSSGVRRIRLNRPVVLNAMNTQMIEELMVELTATQQEGEDRVIMIMGSGRSFSTGADLSADLDKADLGYELERRFNPLLRTVADSRLPIVAAVHGAVAGGALGLALAADFIVAARSAYFLAPFAHLGLVADVGVTWFLPRLIGRARASRMLMLAEPVQAQTALDWGLVHSVVEDDQLEREAMELAQRLAAGPTQAFGLMRRAMLSGLGGSLADSLALERANQRIAGRTPDHAEGLAAFRQKRPPQFTGA